MKQKKRTVSFQLTEEQYKKLLEIMSRKGIFCKSELIRKALGL